MVHTYLFYTLRKLFSELGLEAGSTMKCFEDSPEDKGLKTDTVAYAQTASNVKTGYLLKAPHMK
jgi:hypothetical protein